MSQTVTAVLKSWLVTSLISMIVDYFIASMNGMAMACDPGA